MEECSISNKLIEFISILFFYCQFNRSRRHQHNLRVWVVDALRLVSFKSVIDKTVWMF